MYHTWRQRQWGRPPPPQPPSPPPQPQNSAAEPQVSEEKQSDGDDSASDALPQMSEYDLMWLENIRCNEALLGVDGTTQTRLQNAAAAAKKAAKQPKRSVTFSAYIYVAEVRLVEPSEQPSERSPDTYILAQNLTSCKCPDLELRGWLQK